jgi:hypothetical protein
LNVFRLKNGQVGGGGVYDEKCTELVLITLDMRALGHARMAKLLKRMMFYGLPSLYKGKGGHKQVTEYMILKNLSRAIASAVHYPGAFEVASGTCLDAG